MSGASITKKVNKAYDKVAKKLGYIFDVYRSDDYLQPVQDRNLFKTVKAAYSYDEGFSGGKEEGLSPMMLYVNPELFREGDIFYSEEAGVMLTVASKFDMRVMMAVETDQKISVSRTVYATTGGFGPKGQVVYTDVPARVLQTSTGGYAGAGGLNSSLPDTSLAYKLWVWFPKDKPMLTNDTIVFEDGSKGVISSIDNSGLGYTLGVVVAE